jgi:large subunit GTPase 1
VLSQAPRSSVTPDDQTENKEWIRIPRRPRWDTGIQAKELQRAEEESFLEWRRGLARIEDAAYFILTPFERNLEIWRQLWRVIEACETVVQILDARNPLLFYCEDLKTYIAEVGQSKKMLLLINKADHLSADQRQSWAEYFENLDLRFVFYSATLASETKEEELLASRDETCKDLVSNHDILDRMQLLNWLKIECGGEKLGMVGYPNVGKSSTINSLAGAKKVSVAATPGKTKHFQTVILENDVTLYDCPGLVFPNFAVSRADLVLNGILPVDQLREWVSPVELLIERIPKRVIELVYGIELPKPSMEEDLERRPSSHEVLGAFAIARGFRTSFHGNPDESRAARVVLKDYVAGKLLFCHPPPSVQDEDAFNYPYRNAICERPSRKFTKATEFSYTAKKDPSLIADHKANGVLSGMSGTSRFIKPIGSKRHYKRDGHK